MGQSADFGYALWAIAQNRVNSPSYLTSSFKGKVRPRTVHGQISSIAENPPSSGKNSFRGGIALKEYSGEFEVQFETALEFKIGTQVKSSDKNTRSRKPRYCRFETRTYFQHSADSW